MTVEVRAGTNADLIAPYVGQAKTAALAALEHFKANPDELAVAVTPVLMLALATRRHNLNFAEAALVSEVAIWGGIFAVQAYQQWKTRPAGTVPRLRKVQ